MPAEESEILPAVWCLMTLKVGLALLYYSKYYQVPDVESENLVTEETQQEDA